MKGPRSRHRFCVLRVWECPQCSKRVAAPIHVVNRVCLCQGSDKPASMRLIEERRRPARNLITYAGAGQPELSALTADS